MVGEACDGREAVEGCRASAPDVALLDIQMPLLDGVSVARQVLADRAAKCVIILTAFSDREHIERVQACGAAGYLTKPFEAEKILPTIELCIARSKEYYLLNKEYQHLSRRCQNREPIDQAKLLLMETRGMREDEAYQYILELSRRKGMSMARVARNTRISRTRRSPTWNPMAPCSPPWPTPSRRMSSSTAGPSAGALPSWSVRRSPKPSPPTTAAPSWVC